jgi:hypothetical protein
MPLPAGACDGTDGREHGAQLPHHENSWLLTPRDRDQRSMLIPCMSGGGLLLQQSGEDRQGEVVL